MLTTLCIILVVVQAKLAMIPAEKITATMIEDLTKGLAELLPIIKSIKSNSPPSYNKIDDRSSLKHSTKWKGEFELNSNVPSNSNIEMINIINPKNDETISFEKKTIVVSKYPGSKVNWANGINAINGESIKSYPDTKGFYRSNYVVPRSYAAVKNYGTAGTKYKPLKNVGLGDDQFNFNGEDNNARDFSDMTNEINDNTETSAEKFGWDIFDQNKTTEIKSNNSSDSCFFEEKKDDIKDWYFPKERNHPPIDATPVDDDEGLLEIFTGLVLKHSVNETTEHNATVSNMIIVNQTAEITSRSPI